MMVKNLFQSDKLLQRKQKISTDGQPEIIMPPATSSAEA